MDCERTTLYLFEAAPRPEPGPGIVAPWRAAQAEIEHVLGGHWSAYRSYIAPLRPLRVADGRLSLAAPEPLLGFIARRYGGLLLEAARRQMPEVRAIELLPDGADGRSGAVRIAARAPKVSYDRWGS